MTFLYLSGERFAPFGSTKAAVLLVFLRATENSTPLPSQRALDNYLF
jgi:hypothetical protein